MISFSITSKVKRRNLPKKVQVAMKNNGVYTILSSHNMGFISSAVKLVSLEKAKSIPKLTIKLGTRACNEKK